MQILHQIVEQFLRSLDITPASYQWLLPTSTSITIANLNSLAASGDFPSVHGLADSIVYAFYLGVARMLLQYLIFKPLAVYCLKLKTVRQEAIYSIDILARNKEHDALAISKHVNLDVKLVEEYLWLRRRNRAMHTKITKFVEALWRFIFYFAFVLVGYNVLFTPTMAPWVGDSKQLFADWPFHPITPRISFYYQIELACYLHQLMWTEINRSDTVEMVVHHIVTIALLVFSFLTNFTRIGTFILFVHDSADIFLEMGKVFNYIQRVKGNKWAGSVTDGFFALFTVTFFISRLVVYPKYLVLGFIVEAYAKFGIWNGYWFYTILLIVLQCLHVFWFYLISRMIYRLVQTGIVEKDARSDDDDNIVNEEAPLKGEFKAS